MPRPTPLPSVNNGPTLTPEPLDLHSPKMRWQTVASKANQQPRRLRSPIIAGNKVTEFERKSQAWRVQMWSVVHLPIFPSDNRGREGGPMGVSAGRRAGGQPHGCRCLLQHCGAGRGPKRTTLGPRLDVSTRREAPVSFPAGRSSPPRMERRLTRGGGGGRS